MIGRAFDRPSPFVAAVVLGTAAVAGFTAAEGAAAATLDRATGLTVTKVAIEAGRLVVAGKTRRPGEVVVLVDTGAAIRSDAARRFRFQLARVDDDCLVGLRVGEATLDDLVIASCAPRGERGERGERGPAGKDGARGPRGSQGPRGPAGQDSRYRSDNHPSERLSGPSPARVLTSGPTQLVFDGPVQTADLVVGEWNYLGEDGIAEITGELAGGQGIGSVTISGQGEGGLGLSDVQLGRWEWGVCWSPASGEGLVAFEADAQSPVVGQDRLTVSGSTVFGASTARVGPCVRPSSKEALPTFLYVKGTVVVRDDDP